ncbi:MAG: hypothetical protein BGP12_00335 [Rhodospirillales bacterium 70-18]|nr:hypothetical protein [Rhodospirillales bacterium]OJY78336.1 MAG: hypothetical protein BGP12_00335 [Rhodospirillales bacterium 70-18]
MIRPITFICALLFAVSGLYLYQSKHRSQMVDRQIASTMKAVDEARNHAVLLRAEYALLNDPDRLQELAGQYLSLRPTAPTQFVAMADLGRRLPPVGAPPTVPPPVEPDAPTATAPTATAPTGTAPKPAPATPGAALVASAAPKPAPTPAAVVASIRPAAPPRPAVQMAPVPVGPVQTVSMIRPLPRRPAASPAPTPLHPQPLHPVVAARPAEQVPYPARPYAPRPEPARIEQARATPAWRMPTSNEAPPTTTAEAIRRITRGAPVDPSVPVVASALGMARAMMVAPTAISPASAATFTRPEGGR